ncbi:MAG: lysine-sensitive aspartokinase 3 [Spirochaetales bacterium]|jgi:aspartate kinase|nr:lysine-sensitive aspartokinase 3 [Spirochaetales bacterium]
MVVLKFGGTSVKDGGRIDNALKITSEQLGHAPVLVSSALAGITDNLIEITDIAAGGNELGASEKLNAIKRRHYDAITNTESYRKDAETALDVLFAELGSLVRGLSLLKECSSRTGDAVLAFGELLSTTVILARAGNMGIRAERLDSRDFVHTNADFSSASPDFPKTNKAIRSLLKPEAGKLIIVQGFIGRAPSGATTTLGRGGSDYTAAIIGAALAAREIQIWTDVNGIMTSDPRIVDNARTIGKISYDEAAELSYFGAKVVHPSTIQPATEHNIPVLVKNTLDPEGQFTAVTGATQETGISAIAGKAGITLINITSSRMLNAYGFLSGIFSVFEKHKTSVDLIATSEVSVSVTIDNPASVEAIAEDLEKLGRVGIEKNKAIVCLVGKDLWKDPSFIARVFASLQTTAVRMISLGSSDINLSFVVSEEELSETVRTLHRSFFSAG